MSGRIWLMHLINLPLQTQTTATMPKAAMIWYPPPSLGYFDRSLALFLSLPWVISLHSSPPIVSYLLLTCCRVEVNESPHILNQSWRGQVFRSPFRRGSWLWGRGRAYTCVNFAPVHIEGPSSRRFRESNTENVFNMTALIPWFITLYPTFILVTVSR